MMQSMKKCRQWLVALSPSVSVWWRRVTEGMMADSPGWRMASNCACPMSMRVQGSILPSSISTVSGVKSAFHMMGQPMAMNKPPCRFFRWK